jgi:HAD superfamily hydrolase (TIGR01509 family)
MIIIIPIGGNGKRFKDNGYKNPKALISVYEKPIISYLLDNLKINNIDYIFIPYNIIYKEYNFEEFLIKEYPKINFKFLCLENNTKGAAESIKIGIDNLNENRDIPVICLDCDNFYLCDIISQWNGENCIFSFEDLNENPIYSYVKKNENNEIIDIKEKEKISNNACTGAYGFKSINDLKKYTFKIINENITQKSEFYTSGVIKEMINDGYMFKNIEVLNKNYFSLGTPELVNEYENPFIFDLDGTLVDTDNIYLKVWNDIMKKYNLYIDTNFFKVYIQGKNDILFLKEIFPNITDKEIKEISIIKDELFNKYLKLYDKNILIDGAYNFINKNKNRKTCIVTSSNKKSAEYILEYTKINNYIQFLIASEDCNKHKPDKEPYEKAINILNCDKNKCIIFEDSYPGYKSAKSLEETKICLIVNNNSSEYILNLDNYKIESYNDFDINKLYLLKDNNIILNEIKNKLEHLYLKDIVLNNNNLKTGYICDIKSISLIFNDRTENIIAKIENEDNELSHVARKINLYENEQYFYEKLSKIVNIKIPKFYTGFKINNKNIILLKDLNYYNGCFNIDLNIDIILLIIKNISDLHYRFYFKKEDKIITDMKPLLKINEIFYYEELIKLKFNIFMENNNNFLLEEEKDILYNIRNKFNKLINLAGKFPLNFCHGDLKSPNIFFKNTNNIIKPIFLDWQYIHLNKGISDIVFFLVESIDFNENIIDIIIKYYFYKSKYYINISDLLFDFKVALCIYPYFVMIWFGSENRELLIDKIFPIKFMKNVLKYYNKYLDKSFFDYIDNC